jgi:hypothetical protein
MAIPRSGHPKILCSNKEGLFAQAAAARTSTRSGRPALFDAATRRSRSLCSDTDRSAVQDVFAFAITLFKPKYNRLALAFVSSY